MNLAEELERLERLHQSGAINDPEFAQAKAALFARQEPMGDRIRGAMDGMVKDQNTWALLIHLSQFLGYLIPLAGFVAPVILWQVKKDVPLLDTHGRIVVNWLISQLIFAIVAGMLVFVLIGIPMLIALSIMAIAFPIIGAVKAMDGVAWPYPCSISFLRIN